MAERAPASLSGSVLERQVAFVRRLRRAGLAVVPSQTADYLRALELIDLKDRRQVFDAGRCLLVSRAEDLALYDELFARFWGGPARAPVARKPRPPAAELRPTVLSYRAERAGAGDPEVELDDRSGTASEIEILRRRDFARLSDEELETVRRLMRELRWPASLRVSRRRTPASRGRHLDLRAILRQAARYGGLSPRLFYRRPKLKPRPLVVLADISGSMEKYSRLLLELLHSLSHGMKEVESFVFGTRLTRLTPQLALRHLDQALEKVSEAVVDFSGGTRIGESLARFNRRWGRRVLHRGALVLVVSDGWERGDPNLLAREMRFLQHRCHRLVWLNPLLGDPRYRPLAAGMAAALPFVDDFLPVHDLASLEQLVAHLAALPARRSARRQALELPCRESSPPVSSSDSDAPEL